MTETELVLDDRLKAAVARGELTEKVAMTNPVAASDANSEQQVNGCIESFLVSSQVSGSPPGR